jgi:hypothetical protein
MAHICCSPPDMLPHLAHPVAELGEELDDPVDIGVAIAPPAQAEVVLDAQAREEAPSFGDVGDAEVDDLLDRLTGDGLARGRNLSLPDRHHPGQRPQQRRLAGPVGTHERDDLVARTVEVDVPEHLHPAIAGRQVA